MNFRQLNNEVCSSGLTEELLKSASMLYKCTEDDMLSAFILKDVLEAYSYLFKQQDKLEKNIALYKTYKSFITEDSLLGSGELKDCLDIILWCKETKQNPVYYLSAIFKQKKFKNRNLKSAMRKPTSKELHDKSVFEKQKVYDREKFYTDIQRKHRSIFALQNTFIAIATHWFDYKISNVTIDEVIEEEKTTMINEMLRDGYLPISYQSLGDVSTKVSTSFLKLYYEDDTSYKETLLDYCLIFYFGINQSYWLLCNNKFMLRKFKNLFTNLVDIDKLEEDKVVSLYITLFGVKRYESYSLDVFKTTKTIKQELVRLKNKLAFTEVLIKYANLIQESSTLDTESIPEDLFKDETKKDLSIEKIVSYYDNDYRFSGNVPRDYIINI